MSNQFSPPPEISLAAFVSSIQAVADYQDRAAGKVGEVSAYPPDLHHMTAYWMNVHDIELHELEAWNEIKRNGQLSSAEAAEVIHRSRKDLA